MMTVRAEAATRRTNTDQRRKTADQSAHGSIKKRLHAANQRR
jgi:hypothetical protein